MDVLAVVLTVSILITKGDAWWQDLDCQVTEWTAWSEPYGFGQISRERRILRHPTGTGKSCPGELLQLQFIETEIPQNTIVQAKHFKNEFFRFYNPNDGRTKRQSPVGELRDLLVILDNSGSIGNENFDNAKTQIGRLLGLLCPQPDPFDTGYQQVAFITFSEDVYDIFHFNSYTGISAIQSAINQAPYVGDSTCTAAAFRYVDDMFQSAKGARKRQGVKQEVLIITDGQSNCGGNAIAEALKVHGIADVFGLMVGDFDSSGREEVTHYVSKPNRARERQGVKQEVLIITDGQSNCGGNAIDEARKVHGNTDFFGLMVGDFSSSGREEVTHYVFNPSSQHLFYLNSFAEIETFVDTVESEMQQCSASCGPFDLAP